MATPTTKTELLKSHEHELVKQYIEYDGQNRPVTIYTASDHVEDGGACLRTDYEYLDATSTQITKRRESYDVWQAAWDI